MTRAEWLALARKRLVSVLRKRIVATDRTLEQKISDAGPNNQRVEPVILTEARNSLTAQGRIVPVKRGKTPWFHLFETPAADVQERLAALEPIYLKTQDGMFSQRVGQVLEIAVLRALKGSGRAFLGDYPNLDEPDENGIYHKTEPALVVSGKKIEKGPLDYVVFEPYGMGGIEIKNYRNWLYPDTAAVKELLWKCSDIGAVPVLIARRVPFITFRLLNLSGCIVHQNYNQLYSEVDQELAELVRNKDLLGYHDVRVGNEPDRRMRRFVQEMLPDLVDGAQSRFENFSDLHAAYGKGEIGYPSWMERILIESGLRQEREMDEPEGEYYPEDFWDDAGDVE